MVKDLEAPSAGPLAGAFVVDASWGSPGSIASMLLADYGAQVVKVERPGGGPDRDAVERKAWQRNKWSIELDIGNAADHATLQELLERADIFIESYGQEQAEEVGLDSATTTALNPRLVHCAITAYGRDGPWADRPGYDALVAARMGFMAEQPGHRSSPVYLGHPSIAYTTGFLTAIGALAALRARHTTGRGQRVDTSLLDGVLGQAPMNWWFSAEDQSYLDSEEKGHFGHRRVLIDIYECGDGEYLMMHSGGQGGFKAAMEVLGVGEHFKTITDKVEMSVPLDEEEFEIARQVVPTLWKKRPRDEWLELLYERDVAAVPLLRPGEVLGHEQVLQTGMAVEMADADHGTVTQAAPGIDFGLTPAATPHPAPAVGAHNDRLDELLARPSVTADPSLVGAGGAELEHALSGIRVLDFSQFMAAAYGTKYMSDLGADVIKIEPPTGDAMRSLPDPFEACQRGKRAITIDLSTEEGKEQAYRLVETADVVVHNMRPGKAEKIGIGYDRLKEVKKDLIYCYQPGWGSTGPFAMRKSFAPLPSGFTGLMYIAAGEGNKPVRRARASEDYYGGFLGASAILMALEHRARTGEGQRIEVPQLHASLFAVSEHMLDADGLPIPVTASLDSDQRGIAPLYRLFPCEDGWVCVTAVGDRAHGRLRKALGLPTEDATEPDVRQTAAALEVLSSDSTVSEVCELLEEHQVPCEHARETPFMPDFFWQDWALESEHVFEHLDHAEWGYIREVGQTVRLSETPGRKTSPGPLLGEHNAEVMAELERLHARQG